jgi:hypothetical protein
VNLRTIRVFVFVLILMTAAAQGVSAEPEIRNPRYNIVLAPSSAAPIWDWLRKGTRANDPFEQQADRDVRDPGSVRIVSRIEEFPTRRAYPKHATTFAFTAGKNWWAVQYDPKRHLAFYSEGCCSYHREVLAKIGTPPAGVVHADLGRMIPTSGIRIGDSAAAVFAKLGTPARRLRSPATTRWAAAYARPFWSSPQEKRLRPKFGCVEQGTAVFSGGRLVAYELWYGC